MAGEFPRDERRIAKDLAKRYWDFIFEISVGEGPAMWIPSHREKIYEEGLLTPEIEELDRIVLEEALEGSLDWLPDDDTKPLEKWWWHLRKIARREYPAELLPDYLRETYLRAA